MTGTPIPFRKRKRKKIAKPEGLRLVVDRQERRAVGEDLASARCPMCGYVLVARQGRTGPYFYCLCAERKAA